MNQGERCSAKVCKKPAYRKGRCSVHDARDRDRRLNPDQLEKSLEASKALPRQAQGGRGREAQGASDTICGKRIAVRKQGAK